MPVTFFDLSGGGGSAAGSGAAPPQAVEEARAFLEETFRAAGRDVPPLEEDEETIAAVLRIARLSRERTERTLALARTYRAVAEEYLREGARQAEVLHEVGVSEAQLSQAGRESVAAIARAAADLGVRDCRPSSLLAAATEASFRAWGEADDARACDEREADLQAALRLAESRLAALRPVVEGLDGGVEAAQATQATKRENLKTLDQKERQYQQQLTNYREALARAGARMELRHSVLVGRAQERDELAGELAPLKAELARYGGLPADKLQVQRAVEEKRRRLKELQGLLEEKLGGLPAAAL